MTYLLWHSAPSWILSKAENLASSSLQDGATEWHYYLAWTTHPPPATAKLFLRIMCGVPTITSQFDLPFNNVQCHYPCHVRCPHPIEYLSTLLCAMSPPHFEHRTHFDVWCPRSILNSENIFMFGVPALVWTFEHIFMCGVPTLFWRSEHIFKWGVLILFWTSEHILCAVSPPYFEYMSPFFCAVSSPYFEHLNILSIQLSV